MILPYVEETPYFAGSFMWTGFDYRGEGNPFVYANAASSFGTIDLCGMEKPPFYYRSWWTAEPTIKLAPHWNYKNGETAKITVFTNCETVTLYVNGRSVGTKTPKPFETPVWEIPFESGVLTSKGIKEGKEGTDEIRTSGKMTEIRISDVLDGGEDGVGIIELDAYDENGVLCPLDSTAVTFELASGEIVGVGNGAPCILRLRTEAEEGRNTPPDKVSLDGWRIHIISHFTLEWIVEARDNGIWMQSPSRVLQTEW